jgi:hypothetical protein
MGGERAWSPVPITVIENSAWPLGGKRVGPGATHRGEARCPCGVSNWSRRSTRPSSCVRAVTHDGWRAVICGKRPACAALRATTGLPPHSLRCRGCRAAACAAETGCAALAAARPRACAARGRAAVRQPQHLANALCNLSHLEHLPACVTAGFHPAPFVITRYLNPMLPTSRVRYAESRGISRRFTCSIPSNNRPFARYSTPSCAGSAASVVASDVTRLCLNGWHAQSPPGAPVGVPTAILHSSPT